MVRRHQSLLFSVVKRLPKRLAWPMGWLPRLAAGLRWGARRCWGVQRCWGARRCWGAQQVLGVGVPKVPGCWVGGGLPAVPGCLVGSGVPSVPGCAQQVLGCSAGFWGAQQVLGCPSGARQGGSRHPEHLRQGGCVAVPGRPLSAPKCFGIRHLMRTKEINWWFRPNETAVQINSPHQQKQTESLNELLRSITLSKLLPG